MMLEHLAAVARSNGIERFDAETLPDNRAMMDVFRHAGFDLSSHFDSGVIDVSFPLTPSHELELRIDERVRVAVVASIRRILNPTSIAVVGASRTAGTIGFEIVHNLLRGGFTGAVLPVNPNADRLVAFTPTPPSATCRWHLILVMIAVPAEGVAAVIEECGKAHAGGIVIISAALPNSVLRAAPSRPVSSNRHAGTACVSLARTAWDLPTPIRRCGVTTFAPVDPIPGNVAFMTQSGALGISRSTRVPGGASASPASSRSGTKADISGNDLLRYWETDDSTAVIALYLESFGNPRKFVRVASCVARVKPIIAVKSGRSPWGPRRVISLGGAGDLRRRRRTGPVVVGCHRNDTLEELFDTTQAFASQPPPAGCRVAIVGNAGGPAILAADAAAANGLVVGELSRSDAAASQELPPASCCDAAIRSTSSLPGCFAFEQALRVVLDDPEIDAVLALDVPPLLIAIARCSMRSPQRRRHIPKKTMLATVLAGNETVQLGVDGADLPLSRIGRSSPGAHGRSFRVAAVPPMQMSPTR